MLIFCNFEALFASINITQLSTTSFSHELGIFFLVTLQKKKVRKAITRVKKNKDKFRKNAEQEQHVDVLLQLFDTWFRRNGDLKHCLPSL